MWNLIIVLYCHWDVYHLHTFFFLVSAAAAAKSFSVVSDWTLSLWTAAHQAPLFMGFSRQEYWNGLPFPSPFNLSILDYWLSHYFKTSLGHLQANQMFHNIVHTRIHVWCHQHTEHFAHVQMHIFAIVFAINLLLAWYK